MRFSVLWKRRAYVPRFFREYLPSCLISALSCGEYPIALSPAHVLTIFAASSSHAVAIRYDSSLSLDEADGEQIFVIWLRSGQADHFVTTMKVQTACHLPRYWMLLSCVVTWIAVISCTVLLCCFGSSSSYPRHHPSNSLFLDIMAELGSGFAERLFSD